MAHLFDDLLRPEVQNYLFSHAGEDEKALVLKHNELLGLPVKLIASQLAGRKKAKEKIPLYYNTPGVVYPPLINIEQSSSEATALFKASVIKNLFQNVTGLQGVDLTGGFGVDSYFLSILCETFRYVESDQTVLDLAQHNHIVLGSRQIEYTCETAEEFIKEIKSPVHFMFVDPSRRKNDQKVFRLADCSPDLTALLPALLHNSKFVLIKASPLLDLQQGMRDLSNVHSIYVVAVKNECREILFLCDKQSEGKPEIVSVNIQAAGAPQQFSFTFAAERAAVVDYSDPLTFLYEPNAAILKAGAFKMIARAFGLKKMQQHTHLYTSNDMVDNFPGRVFRIESSRPTQQQLTSLPGQQVNVMTRNYPLSPEQIRKKYKVRDGGEKFLIGFSGMNDKFLVIASRITSLSAL